MKFQKFDSPAGLRPIEPGTPSVGSTGQGSSIEDLPGAVSLAAPRHSDRWLGITIAICAAVVCFGFASHAAAPAPVASPTTVLVPPSLPSSPAPAEATPPPAPTLSGSMVDRPAGAAEEGTPPVWDAQVVTDRAGRRTLVVGGSSPTTIHSLAIRVLTPGGRLVASYVDPVVVEDERPATNGQPRTGLASFEWMIALPNRAWTHRFIVELAWHDVANSSSGTIRQPVPASLSAISAIWEPFALAESPTL